VLCDLRTRRFVVWCISMIQHCVVWMLLAGAERADPIRLSLFPVTIATFPRPELTRRSDVALATSSCSTSWPHVRVPPTCGLPLSRLTLASLLASCTSQNRVPGPCRHFGFEAAQTGMPCRTRLHKLCISFCGESSTQNNAQLRSIQ
jgi:hypothetical protein